MLANEQEAFNRASTGAFNLVRIHANLLHSAIHLNPQGSPVSAISNLRVITVPADDLVYLLVNWKSSAFFAMTPEQKASWRARFSEAINRKALATNVYLDQAAPADRALHNGEAPQNIVPARDWSAITTIELLTPPLGELRQVGDQVQTDLRGAGLDASVRLVSINDFISRLGKSDFQVAVLWLESNISEPTLSWATFFQEGGAASLFGDPLLSVGPALSDARSLPLGPQRDEALKKIASDINSQQMRVIPLVRRSVVFLADESIANPGIDRNGILQLSLISTRNTKR